MERNKSHSRSWRAPLRLGGVLVLVLCLVWPTSQAEARRRNKGKKGAKEAAARPVDMAKQKKLVALLNQDFTYERENRADPFTPFITDKTVESPEESTEKLTGMQLFEPGQLQLVAILFSGTKAVAMVQDSSGKGYIIDEGTKIGRRGVVEKIAPNVVTIRQWHRTPFGEKQYEEVEMVLRKEGDTKS